MLPAIPRGTPIGRRYSAGLHQAFGHASSPARSAAGAADIWAVMGALGIVDFAAIPKSDRGCVAATAGSRRRPR